MNDILQSGIGRRIKYFKGYCETEPNEEGKFLFTYLVKNAFKISREEEGYEVWNHNIMIDGLKDRFSNELKSASEEIIELYNFVQSKIKTEPISLKRVLPKIERFDNNRHFPNILSSYTTPNNVGDYGSHHDRILKRDVPKKEILIHPNYVRGFLNAEHEFIVINRTPENNEGISYTEDDNCSVTPKP